MKQSQAPSGRHLSRYTDMSHGMRVQIFFIAPNGVETMIGRGVVDGYPWIDKTTNTAKFRLESDSLDAPGREFNGYKIYLVGQ